MCTSLSKAEVTFYDGDPTDGGYELTTVPMNNSPFGNVVLDIENQDHVVLVVDGSSYTFKTLPGGNSKYSVYLDRGEADPDDAMTLAEAIDGMTTNSDFAGTLDR